MQVTEQGSWGTACVSAGSEQTRRRHIAGLVHPAGQPAPDGVPDAAGGDLAESAAAQGESLLSQPQPEVSHC